jgi:hypothetical protein
MKRAPNGLGTKGKAFWRSVLDVYELSPSELAILERACRVLDRLERIDFIAARSAPAVKGSRDNLRPNPVYQQAIEHEKAFDMLVRSLALPMPDEAEGFRRSPDQRAKAQKRWSEEKRLGQRQREKARYGELEA